jgi:hypothetical protein
MQGFVSTIRPKQNVVVPVAWPTLRKAADPKKKVSQFHGNFLDLPPLVCSWLGNLCMSW